MKKIMIIVGALTLSTSMFAQKQVAGSQTVELEFAPLGSEPFKVNSLRYRYFKSENTAYRMSLFLGGKSTSTLGDTIGGAAQTKDKNSNFDFALKPGIEKHFVGTDKLSPYYGAELFLGIKKTKNNDEENWTADNKQIGSTTTKTPKTSMGLNVLMGADYYISSNLYLGAELGFGFLKDGLGKTKTTYEHSEDTTLKDTDTKGNTSELKWGPNYQGTIRIGWIFK